MPARLIRRTVRLSVIFIAVLGLVAGCGKSEPTATHAPPTDTSLPPNPTQTPVPLTATQTPVSPTATPAPPTDTPLPVGAGVEPEGDGLYLGQTPPGLDVQVFAPGIVSIEEGKEYKITFSPDLQEIFFTRRTPGGRDDGLWYSRLENGELTLPEPAPFSYDALESDACFTPDGKRLYFNSWRPLPGQDAPSERHNVWFVDRTGEGWSEPQLFDSPLDDYRPVYFSMADNGTMYFTCSRPREICYAELQGGQYREVKRLPDEINDLRDVAHPAIAPDESYIVVDSYYQRGGRLVGALYVSFKKPDGSWTPALSMKEVLKASESDVYASPRITPDGKYLFFESYVKETDQADIYWVSTAVIEALRPQEMPAPLTGGGLIAFVSTRDGNGEIYVMDADGSNPRRLTNYRQWDGFPDWSPDGEQIVYYSYLSSKNWVIKVMDVKDALQSIDGGNPRQLTDSGTCDGAPHWSPDGTWITYDSGDCTGSHRDVYVINVKDALQSTDGSNPRNLTNNEADDMLAAWSPDSTRLVFSSNRDGNYEIYVMDTDGGNVRRLTENTADDHAPAWSPDGTQIAFYSNRDGNEEIYVMDVKDALQGTDGGNPRNLTNNPTEDWFPRWSPDGSQITFSSKRDGNLDIYVMNADGSNVRRLTDSPREDFNSVWQLSPTEAPPATWSRTYEGNPEAAALGALQTGDGGYLLVGATNHSHRDTRHEDVHLMKVNSAGETLWEKTYGGEGYDRGQEIVPADDGGFVILAETESFGAGERDVYLLKVDGDGNELWSGTFGGPGREGAFAIQPTADGGYIITGGTASYGAEGSDVYLLKTDGLGGEVWSQAFGGEYDEEGYAVHQTPDGGFFVLAGVTHGEAMYTEQNPDVYLLRTDGAGAEIWSQVWEKEGVQGGNALLPTDDGGYIVAGILVSPESGSGMDFLFQKIDGEGHEIWDKTIHDESIEGYVIDVAETSDGGYILVGMSMRGGRGGIPLIKTDGEGNVAWVRNLVEERGNKAGMKVFQAPDGGYVIVGIVGTVSRTFDTLLIKTDSEGNVND